MSLLLRKLTITLLCSSILTACTLPLAKRPQPSPKSPSATALATGQLPPELPVVNPPLHGMPIPELPRTKPQPFKEFNRVGEVPKVSDLSDKTLSDKALSNLDEAVPIKLDFEQTSLRDFIGVIGDALKLNMVIDPSIGDKITLRTAKDKLLRKQDLWPLLQLLLTEASVTVEKKGNVYHFIKTGPSLPGIISVSPDALTGSDASEVLQISPLRYISVDTAIMVLSPLLQPAKGRILSLPNVNVIGIITSPQRLERVNKLLAIIDADPFQHHGMRLFRLTNSKATEIQPELEKIFQALSGRTPPAYVSIPLDRINSLLVIAPPGGSFDDVATWVDILDGRSEESGEQIFIYRVKNLEAGKLAGTLSSVFKTAEQRKEDEKLKRQQQQEKERNPNLPGEPIPPQPPVLPPGARTPGGALAVSAELKVNIVADESTNTLLIRANPRDYRQLLETIYALDQIPKEVMINVVIAEVTLTESTKFGIDWQVLFGKARGADGKQRSYTGIDFNVPGKTTADSPLAGFVIDQIAGRMSAVLNLVASTNDLSILSRPSLLVRNNEEASMNVGSNEPFLGAINNSTLNNQQISQDVQYKDTGITLKVTPRINDDGVINMKIEQELSQIGPTRTTQNLQSFIQRKVTTSVVVRDGSAIIIGGLIQTNRKNDQQGIPVLRDLPVVGNTLFSSTDKEDTRTELVLIMVPTVVSPELDNSQLMQDFRQRIKMVSDLLNEQDLGYFLPLPAPPPPAPIPRQDKPVSSSAKKK